MRSNYLKTLKTAVLAVTVLLLGAGVTFAQQSVNLTAGPATATLPDGSTVPMWGYSCGAVVTGSTAACANLNTHATPLLGWSPVIIKVPSGQGLTINLTNNLSFPSGATTFNNIPTSLVIVGQLGGGLGTAPTLVPSPPHADQTVTWPIVDPGTTNTPPAQGKRVQSFSTEVAATPTSVPQTATALTWTGLKPGTYLLESGTHPSIQGPMGLYGIVVVTTAPTSTARGVAYGSGTTAVNYDAEVPLLFSEIDPVQNNAVQAAVTTAKFDELKPWSGQPNKCGNPASGDYHTCYPPAVNYTPLYYLINGVAFDKTNPNFSLFPAKPNTGTGVSPTVLVRLVNAGLRMHVPSIVGAKTGASGTGGFSLIAEDGNPLPGVPRVQNEVFLAAGKTYDVMMNASVASLPIYDRELSLSGNSTGRDAGMLAYIGVNGLGLPAGVSAATATANPDVYSLVSGQTLSVSDPGKGVIANDVNIYGVKILTPPAHALVDTAGTHFVLNENGTFSYTPDGTSTSDSFTYCGNGAVSGTGCTTVSFNECTVGSGCLEASTGITMGNIGYTSNLAKTLSIKPPGILSVDKDGKGLPLTVNAASVTPGAGLTSLSVDKFGGFNATVSGPGTYTFTYKAQNSQGTVSSLPATVTLKFLPGNGPTISVKDPVSGAPITDYRWIIEEDRTFFIDPTNTTNTAAVGTSVPTYGTNFHTSYMPVIAQGCVGSYSCASGQTFLDNNPLLPDGTPNPNFGQHVPAVCDVGNGACRFDSTGNGGIEVQPIDVHLDPSKRYYISVLPGDGADALDPNAQGHAHGMGGAPIPAACTLAVGQTTCTGSFSPITVLSEATPMPTAKVTAFVFEDDFPLNGEQDAGGGIDVLALNEPGLGGFEITLFDDAGGSGDATGQMTYDMFNMPLSNSLAGTIDPTNGNDACPISKSAGVGIDTNTGNPGAASPTGITGTIVTCPKYESDGVTLSPLAGQVVVANLMPGRYGIVATPAADRIARGEEWLQTNTLDGQKAHDSFLRVGEPAYFQEYGPAGYHVSIGFANPAIINARKSEVCPRGSSCLNTVTGNVTTARMSRSPDERLYSSGSIDSFGFTQCYVSIGDPDGEDFAFTKCDADGHFSISGLPDGDWRITVFDQWNDMLVDGLATPVRLGNATAPFCSGSGSTQRTCNMGDIATNQWQADIYTRTFFDKDGNGRSTLDLSGTQCATPNVPLGCNPNYGNTTEPGLSLVATNIRFRDGSFSNFNSTDLNGFAGFNEVFPLFSWYVIETDTTRYKNTGTHVVYDAGGPADGTDCTGSGARPCGNSVIARNFANTVETVSVPTTLRVPGSVYCATADCANKSITGGPATSDPPSACTVAPSGATNCTTKLSTGRIDAPWADSYGWQGFSGQNSFLEFGKKPFAPALSPTTPGENGGIHGHVVYASTRPFDDPSLLLQLSWEPLVPNVTINLYQEGTAPDGTQSLTLVDTTKTTSWDDWAQGFRSAGVPNMNCPGQLPAPSSTAGGDLFFFSLYNQRFYLDTYNGQHGGTPAQDLPSNAQFKCYDGMHNWNQLQPAPYDGMYKFPSVTATDASGRPTGTNCTVCIANPAPVGDWSHGQNMLPPGKYVVEVVVPPGYELVKEEDKNILIGDTYIAPVVQQFAGLGNIFIMPDQAAVADTYNANNNLNPTTNLGAAPRHEGDTGSIEEFWPCVGAERTVPDFISLFPKSGEVAPFAGATRNLCDRKEVTLTDQTSALAKFYVFTSTHAAAHFTGIITDDYTSEFDPFSPQFGEKFSPPDMPISIKDFNGFEIARTYSDHWGFFNGLNYSTWEVNPPNPTGYAPQMMVTCMNDPGPIAGPNNTMITDPLYNPQYSQFCYEIPFMPGQTQYMDTPVVPTAAFAGAGYNNPDCEYPEHTPAISEVDGDGQVGPWVATTSGVLTIKSLGVQIVNNNAYSGPSANTSPYNQKKINRTYNFGSTAGTVVLVDSAGVKHPLTNVAWGDTTITGTVPTDLPNCAVQQQTIYGGSTAQCGQLVITSSDGKMSVDTVTVTIGGKAPTHVSATDSIQSKIDAAKPGDLLMVDPGTHNELLIMWKPVRLQGVGAASSIINANTHPAGRMDPWRARMDCLFGLALNGQPRGSSNPFDPNNTFSCGAGFGFGFTNGANNQPQVDRIPMEGVLGWDTSTNGNLAQLLQEPTLMGAYEGAGITVLGKGVDTHGAADYYGAGATESGFPTGTSLLTASNCLVQGNNPFPSNFQCNPSSIDGLSIINSSQGGGGIFVHAWGHNLQIGNNRVKNNSGTLTGGITVGIAETADAILQGTAPDSDPGSCRTSNVTNAQLPFCYDLNVNVHNNQVTSNMSIGDELFSSTPAGGGGVTFCTGADFYKFQNNWVCGNLSTGDGGGVVHLGFIWQGNMEHNAVLFNQSTNPTVPTNGGGIIVMGAPPDGNVGGLECGNTPADADCVPGLSDGTGPGTVINGNLLMGNAAESGSGGGLRLQNVNGTEVPLFRSTPAQWNSVLVTNNIIANNVAGWDGAGISLLDALSVKIINNTVVSNDTTASSGVLFNTLGAPLASSTGPTCTSNCGTMSADQPAGLVVVGNSPQLTGVLPANITCPSGITGCRNFSVPILYNDLFWQNRSYHIGVGNLGSGTQNQQNVVSLYLTSSGGSIPAPSQPQAPATGPNGGGTIFTGGTGACFTSAGSNNYWDIGVRGDTSASSHGSLTLTPTYSVLTTGYTGNGNPNHNSNSNPTVVSQYCNGSRIPPELGSAGYQVPAGISDATVPNPIFNLTPAATVDEGNNWINLSWGPLSLISPAGTTLGNYSPATGSPAIDYIPSSAGDPYTLAPLTDFFGNTRKAGGNAVDVGAVEVGASGSGGGGGGGAQIPTLSVLDNFNRPTALNLNNNAPAGVAWNATLVGVNDVTPGNTNTGVAASIFPGSAYWNGTAAGPVFGNRQAAAFTFAGGSLNNTGLVLKATGTSPTAPTSYVRVRYTTTAGGTITIATTANGTAFTTAATLTGFGNFATGDTLTAMVDATGAVNVWKTHLGVTTPITSSPVSTLFTGTGRIGMQLGALSGVDNFAGATVP